MRNVDEHFYKTKQWRQVQAAYMRHVDYLCERCRQQGKKVPARIVHHKQHLNPRNVQDPAIAYGFNNLEALCQDCHNKEHFGAAEKPKRRWTIRPDGTVTGKD